MLLFFIPAAELTEGGEVEEGYGGLQSWDIGSLALQKNVYLNPLFELQQA